MESPQLSIYKQVLRVTHVYLGPVADRFIDRQIENHVHKPPNNLTKDDLVQLIDWIKAVVSLLTEDTEIVEEYINELSKIANGNKKIKNGL